MRVTVERDDLVGLLRRAMSAYSRHMALPILGTIRLDAIDSTLSASCSTSEEWASDEVPAQVAEAGSACVTARFAEYVKTLPSGPLELTTEDNLLLLEQGRNTARFMTMPTDDFPTAPMVEGPTFSFYVPQLFGEAVKRTIVCAATSYYDSSALLACHIRFDDEGVTLVAADGFRLAKSDLKYDWAEWFSEEHRAAANIPATALKRLLALVEKETDLSIDITVGKTHTELKSGSFRFVTQHIGATYPDYEKVLDQASFIRAELAFERDAMREAVRRAAILAREADDIVRFEQQDDVLRVAATSEVGNNECYVPTVVVRSDGTGGVKVALNSAYMLDMLKAMPENEVRIRWTSPSAAVLFVPAGGGYEHMIMPMYVVEE